MQLQSTDIWEDENDLERCVKMRAIAIIHAVIIYEISHQLFIEHRYCLADDKANDLPEGMSEVKKISKGPLVFGLDPTNPQDWITVVLTGIIVYETFDLAVFWFQKLTGFQGFQSSWKATRSIWVIPSIQQPSPWSLRKIAINHFDLLNCKLGNQASYSFERVWHLCSKMQNH